jgi:prepilin-type N-terminal cleavage/methylation domain-containing protein
MKIRGRNWDNAADKIKGSCGYMKIDVRLEKSNGFSLIEVSIALIILTFGLLAAGQLLYVAQRADSLSRSQGTAALAAQNKLEHLLNVYHQNPSADDLTPGSHGPEEIEASNPIDGSVLNRFRVAWTVSEVLDPRPGKVLGAKQVLVTVVPIGSDGAENQKAFLNKVVSVATIFSTKIQ